ncbi:MSCRAMM family protein [Clostridium tarantellae]|uniref:Carboxypeptidase regulatory-like domain-containing protein n=1 Tax=Clostridium tarantellae TaxID=39493 RepID=A0A6I1MJP9_9CLOT|nr:carboxypeptidase regulatory-like domain-containing protein [Clostridium tarantellae]MPQ42933.1 hypothetical protein [Clostridium tarantellae]
MQVKVDKYKLGRSAIGSMISKQQELTLNIKLKTNPNQNPNINEITTQSFISESLPEFNILQSISNPTISGKVMDSQNNPIENAVVKLMDVSLNPISNTLTDAEGNYSINTSPNIDVYTMLSIASGKILNQTNTFTLLTGESKTMNFTLLDVPIINFGNISGKLIDKTINNPIPISGGVVSLYKKINNNLTLVAMSYTDLTGVYFFNQIDPGDYTLKFNALGFIESEGTITVEKDKIAQPVNMLNDDPVAAKGIISGTILDENNLPIVGADVILYSSSENNTLTPIAFTTTNSIGRYSFMNVPNGNFVVKSNKLEMITV